MKICDKKVLGELKPEVLSLVAEAIYINCGWEFIREVISVDANICCKSRASHFIFRPLPYIFGLFSPHPES